MNNIFKILIIDDDVDFLESIVSILEQTPMYNILQSNNAQKAIEIIQTEIPDLIFTDWDMPNMNGIELIQTVRNNKKTFFIPIIVCTGKMKDNESLQIAFDNGANDFIQKPVKKFEVLARIKSMLQLVKATKQAIKLRKKIARMEYSIIEEKLKTLESQVSIKENDLKQADEKLSNIYQFYEILHKELCDKCKQIKNQWTTKNIITSTTNTDNNVFFKKLKSINPQLSNKEIKICLLLKHQYSTKELSNILHIEPKSINIYRYRIRKKLNLGHNDNLINFLLSL